jgi:subtilisin family serine protease
MSWRKVIPLFFVFAVVIFLVAPSSHAGLDSSSERGIFVRISAEAVSDLDALHLASVQVIDYKSFLWLELDSKDFETLSNSNVAYTVIPGVGVIQIAGYSFDPYVQGPPAMPDNLIDRKLDEGFRLVQLGGPTKDTWLAQLKATGLEVLQYYPHYAYLTWGSAGQANSAKDLQFVRWQGPVHPAYKINSDLQGRQGIIENVDIMFFNDGDIKQTLGAIEALGGSIIQTYASQPDEAFFNSIVHLDASAIEDIARLKSVLWLGYASPEPVLDDEMSSQIVAGNHPAGVPVTGYYGYLASLGYDGSGVIWSTVDTGIDYAHPDLNARIVGGYSYPGAPVGAGPGDDCAGGGHGTHVSGIIGGDATAGYSDPDGFLYGLGMAPGVSFFAQNSLCAPSWPPSGGWQEHSKRGVLGSAIGGNNSWTTGEGTQHGYQSSERTHDIMVRDGNFDTTGVAEPFIEVFSAGNSGGSGLTSPKEGKNLIVTASSLNYRAGSIDLISGFSSRGPAVDGRWVPTVAAPGEDIASSRRLGTASQCTNTIAGTNNTYSYCSGTSMAAPHTSGVIVLTTEWWRTFNGDQDPSPAMAKALVVNGADDMGTADIPNINEGWGRINVTNIISPDVHTIYRDQIDVFNNTGEQYQLALGVSDPTKPFKVTLAWSDAPGAVGANPALVNDLNLTVLNGGNTYMGNVFSGGWSVTGGSADAINNLENVYIQSPSGSAVITIDAVNIAGDGIPYSGDTTDQDFALVCHNCSLFPDFTLSATPASLAVCSPNDASFDIEVGSILGYDDPVTLTAIGNPGGTSVDFSVNPVTPPGSSFMTIGGTGAATAGMYAVDIVGTGPTSTQTTTVGLGISSTPPGTIALQTPANGAINQPTRPTFTWSAANQGQSYEIEIAIDPSFNDIVDSKTLIGLTYTPSSDLNTSAVYYWHVRSTNACGIGEFSAPFRFSTVGAPGDCGYGSTPVYHFEEDFEDPVSGWASGGSGDTWELSVQSSHSPVQSYFAADISSVSDQRLVSPEIHLPAGENPLSLQFWNRQGMEDCSSGCFDGAILEITTDSGANWNQIPNSALLTDPYDGLVSTSYSNPLGGLYAWCGDPQDWLESVVDLTSYAGESVQFRFRLGTDSSVSREGWYIDDMVVQSCQVSNFPSYLPLIQDGATP